jgi:zona occludens toxin (predicted ATPase)
MQGRTSHKLVKATTAALAAALLAVPVAQARLAVDARHAALLNKDAAAQPTVVRTDARHAALLNKDAAVQPTVVRTDARHAGLVNKAHLNPLIVQERKVSTIAQMHRHVATLNLPDANTSVGTVSTGFDWTDAGVGAGAALGLVLLASGGVLVTRRKLVGA